MRDFRLRFGLYLTRAKSFSSITFREKFFSMNYPCTRLSPRQFFHSRFFAQHNTIRTNASDRLAAAAWIVACDHAPSPLYITVIKKKRLIAGHFGHFGQVTLGAGFFGRRSELSSSREKNPLVPRVSVISFRCSPRVGRGERGTGAGYFPETGFLVHVGRLCYFNHKKIILDIL